MRVAYATMLYRYLPPLEAIRRLYEMGVDVYELSYDNFTVARRGQEDALLDQVLQGAKGVGARAASVHLPYDKQTLSQLAEGKEGAFTRMIRWMRAGHELGAAVAVIHTLPLPAGRRESLEANVRVLSRLAREAANLGMTLAVENRLESDIYGASLDELASIVGGVEGLAVCADVGHMNVNGVDPPEGLSRLKGSIAVVHAHDNDGSSDQHLPPMTGTIDWFRVAGSLVGYGGQLTYEVSCMGPQARCDNYVRLLKMVHRNVFG